MPRPPAGVVRCAASPTRSTRRSRKRRAIWADITQKPMERISTGASGTPAAWRTRSTAHGLGEVLGAVLGLEIQMQEPQIAAVDRDIAAADGLAQDVGHERLAVAEAGAEIRMVIDVDEVPHVAGACAGDPERLAHAARGAVGGQEIAGAHALAAARSPGLGWLP